MTNKPPEQENKADQSKDLEIANSIIEEYCEPNSTVDLGNLYFAATVFRDHVKALEAEIARLRDKYDLNLLVKRSKALEAEVAFNKAQVEQDKIYIEHLLSEIEKIQALKEQNKILRDGLEKIKDKNKVIYQEDVDIRRHFRIATETLAKASESKRSGEKC